MTQNNILSALHYLDVSTLSYDEWLKVGMALKEEGFPCSDWVDWSKNDSRFRPGECEKKWQSFHGGSSPVKGGTIVQMAVDRGWSFPSAAPAAAPLSWDATLDLASSKPFTPPAMPSPTQELITYLEQLFRLEDHVSYVTGDVWADADGKWHPSRGVCDRTAGELIDSLKKHPDDIGATIGDWNPEAGAWIRFNPVDGKGIKNENVTRFHFALVESDTLSIEEQERLYRKLELPIAVLVYSGGKSLHAIVRVDASDADEYHNRVDYLYRYLEEHGVAVDRQNRNPSRLSRMPGVTRGGKRQSLVAFNIGQMSWADWIRFIEGASDGLPGLDNLAHYRDNPPPLHPELIQGILRCGHKLLIAGPSKAGKSFLLMELAIAIAEGSSWLGFPCKKGKVLYINLEIDKPSCIHRFLDIYAALGMDANHMDDIIMWNLRGHAIPLDELAPKIIQKVQALHLDAIIVDPIYKVITGDENSATDMASFCNQFDLLCTELDCAAIYCHHHSKGAQGSKRAMDRSSGSGVFARDPDAILDVIQLIMTDDLLPSRPDEDATAWRMDCTLREFASPAPVNFWFSYPVHLLDTADVLKSAAAEGSREGNLSRSSKRTSPENRRSVLDTAYDACMIAPPVKVSDLEEYTGLSEKTIRRYLAEFQDDYWCQNGIVGRKTS
ncbi:MAG: AAA family ATPase [Clostridiales bacterium]|nr:AAA family ATPase [Clostridiales bacterium]